MLMTIFITLFLQKEYLIILKYGHILHQLKLISEDTLIISHCYRLGIFSHKSFQVKNFIEI